MTEVPPYGELSWLLQNLDARVDHVRQAVVLSADGLTMGSSAGLDADDADHLSALAAGVQSLARGASRRFRGGNVRQTVIEMDDALLFVTAAGQGACLAVLADGDADAGSHRDADAGPHGDTDRGSVAHAVARADGNSGTDCDAGPHTDAHADAGTNADLFSGRL